MIKNIFCFLLLFFVGLTLYAKDGDAFSISTDVEGNTVVYGRVYYNHIDSTSQGRVFIYENSGEELVLVKEIPEGEEDNGDYFGGMVALSGDELFVSNYVSGFLDFNEKKVEVYRKTDDGWNYQKTIVCPEEYSETEYTNAMFAQPMDANGGKLIAVANKGVSDKSDILVYSAEDDYVSYKVISPVIEENYNRYFFPTSLGISGNMIVATAGSLLTESEIGPNFIHIFTLNDETGEWDETQRIQVDYENPTDTLGLSVSIDDSRFIVTAFSYEGASLDRALIFEKIENEWKQIKVLAPDVDPQGKSSSFGWNVSISGDFAVVTDRAESIWMPYGNTYIYHRNYNPEDPEIELENNWGLYQKFEMTEESLMTMKGAVAVLKNNLLSLGADPGVNNYVNSKITPYVERLIPPVFSELPDEDVSEEADESIVDDMETPEADDIEINDDDVQAVEKDKSSGSSCSAVII